MTKRSRRILLTGTTGYVGGRRLSRLVSCGYSLRCVARRPAHLLAIDQAAAPELGAIYVLFAQAFYFV